MAGSVAIVPALNNGRKKNTVNRGDFGQIYTILINILIMMN